MNSNNRKAFDSSRPKSTRKRKRNKKTLMKQSSMERSGSSQRRKSDVNSLKLMFTMYYMLSERDII
jgi:hypothetical protein